MDEVRKAIASQFISRTSRDFVDTAKGKRVHFSPPPANVLGTGVPGVSSTDMVSFLKDLTV